MNRTMSWSPGPGGEMHGLPRPPEPVTDRAVIHDRTSDGHLLGPPNTRHRNTSACQSILGHARLGWPSRGWRPEALELKELDK